MRVIGRASLDEIKDLPTDRIAAQLPDLISDVLRGASRSRDPFEMTPEAHERAARLAELRDTREPAAADLARDVAAIQLVILEALRRDADELGAESLAHVAERIAESVAAVQAAAVETLVSRRGRELESLANNDPLTGLSNLRHLHAQLKQALGITKRYEHPFALLVLDIDGLKRVNDAQGHAAGDRVLVQVALAVRRSIRSVDVPARIGGDEFCVLAPDQNANRPPGSAERLARPWPPRPPGRRARRAWRSRSAWSRAPSTATTRTHCWSRPIRRCTRRRRAASAVAVGRSRARRDQGRRRRAEVRSASYRSSP